LLIPTPCEASVVCWAVCVCLTHAPVCVSDLRGVQLGDRLPEGTAGTGWTQVLQPCGCHVLLRHGQIPPAWVLREFTVTQSGRFSWEECGTYGKTQWIRHSVRSLLFPGIWRVYVSQILILIHWRFCYVH